MAQAESSLLRRLDSPDHFRQREAPGRKLVTSMFKRPDHCRQRHLKTPRPLRAAAAPGQSRDISTFKASIQHHCHFDILKPRDHCRQRTPEAKTLIFRRSQKRETTCRQQMAGPGRKLAISIFKTSRPLPAAGAPGRKLVSSTFKSSRRLQAAVFFPEWSLCLLQVSARPCP